MSGDFDRNNAPLGSNAYGDYCSSNDGCDSQPACGNAGGRQNDGNMTFLETLAHASTCDQEAGNGQQGNDCDQQADGDHCNGDGPREDGGRDGDGRSDQSNSGAWRFADQGQAGDNGVWRSGGFPPNGFSESFPPGGAGADRSGTGSGADGGVNGSFPFHTTSGESTSGNLGAGAGTGASTGTSSGAGAGAGAGTSTSTSKSTVSTGAGGGNAGAIAGVATGAAATGAAVGAAAGGAGNGAGGTGGTSGGSGADAGDGASANTYGMDAGGFAADIDAETEAYMANQKSMFTAEMKAQNKMQKQTTEEEFAQKMNDAAWKTASSAASDKIQ